MFFRPLFFILFLTVQLGFTALAQQTRQTPPIDKAAPAKPPTDLRVGLISYEKPEDKIRDYQALFAELALQETDNVSYKPRFAVGTYADVLDWITRALVDVAVLSPNAFSETSAWKTDNRGGEREKEPDCIYLATEGKAPAARDAWVIDKLKAGSEPGKGRFEYNSLCIARASSGITNLDQLRDAATQGRVQFVFGDPLSASGTIWPMQFLRTHGIEFRKHMEYSFGHKDSVDMILAEEKSASAGPIPPEQLQKVAFVQDLAVQEPQWWHPPAEDKRLKLRLIADGPAIKGLNGQSLPMEVWVARKDFDKDAPTGTDPSVTAPSTNSERLRRALLAHVARKRWSATDEETEKNKGAQSEKFREPVTPQIHDFTWHDKKTLEERIAPLHLWAQQIRGLLARGPDAALADDYSKDIAAAVPGMKAPIRFQDVISLVRHYNRIYEGSGKKARLGLVLAGGGAKCAYQAGAIEKMEEILQPANANRQDADKKEAADTPPSRPEIDIELVAGTSGGALNAIPVAVGISRKREQGKDPPLAQTWKELNALNIIRPPVRVALCLGFCYAFVYFVMIRGFVRLLRSWAKKLEQEDRWIIVLGWLFIVIPGGVFLLFYFPKSLGGFLLLRSHGVLYFLLAVSWGVRFAAVLCLLWGGLILVNARERRLPSSAPTPIHRRFVSALLRWSDPRHAIPFLNLSLVGMILVGVALVFALLNKGGLFLGDPLEDVVIAQYAKLFGSSTSGDLRASKGKGLGKAVLENPDRKRDLVITGSSIKEESRGSKYFYLPGAGSGTLPSYGSHGVEISADCDLDRLIDLALGSGTIFPFFPSHPVDENKALKDDQTRRYPLKSMDLIDGGFTHNSPIEAATLWKATHIILIDPTPETTQKGKAKSPFVFNILKAIGYLFDQAQAADVNAQEEAGVFTLRPSPTARPEITILDFSPGFAELALERGRKDAAGWSFVRQPAKPLFWDSNLANISVVSPQP